MGFEQDGERILQAEVVTVIGRVLRDENKFAHTRAPHNPFASATTISGWAGSWRCL